MTEEPEPRLPVWLTLEESGILCHAMMREPSFNRAVLANRGTPIHQRMAALYSRLADVNDRLMGKKPMPEVDFDIEALACNCARWLLVRQGYSAANGELDDWIENNQDLWKASIESFRRGFTAPEFQLLTNQKKVP